MASLFSLPLLLFFLLCYFYPIFTINNKFNILKYSFIYNVTAKTENILLWELLLLSGDKYLIFFLRPLSEEEQKKPM